MVSGRRECGKVAFKVNEIRKSVTICHGGRHVLDQCIEALQRDEI